MGKDKTKGKRVKNQPSSSSVSASLLGQNASFGFGFNSQLEQMSSEFQLSFKKLNKKDATTRSKGLDELRNLFEKNLVAKSDEEKAVINRWTTVWPYLITACEPKNRVLAIQAMGAIATHLGRRLGAYLKAILPAWLITNFDTQKSVQQISQQIFSATIPEHKYTEAMIFCKVEILEYLQKNFTLNIEILATTLSHEEAVEKYERVISSSILLLNHFVSTVGDQENTSLLSNYTSILNEKFWKFLSSKYSLIRKSMYIFVKTLITVSPDLIGINIQVLTPQILAVFSDNDAQTHRALWDAVLHFLKKYPECWKHVNILKQVLPNIYTFLKNGTYGSAAGSYPSFLPLLSLLPTEIISSEKSFHGQFFSSMWSGLSSENINSTTNIHLINAFTECLLYVMLKSRSFGVPDSVQKKFLDLFFEKLTGFLYNEKIESDGIAPAFSKFILQLTKKEHCNDLVIQFWNMLLDESKKGNLYWNENDQLKDISKSTIFCEHLYLFLNQFTLGENVNTCPPMLEFCKQIYCTLSISINKDFLPQMDLISKLISEFTLQSLTNTDTHRVIAEDIFPFINKWINAAKPKKQLECLFRICSAYFKTIIKNKNEIDKKYAKENWDILLNNFKNSQHIIIFKLCEMICDSTHDIEFWHHEVLDIIAKNIANGISGNTVNFDSARLLSFLISGHDLQAYPLISPVTLKETCSIILTCSKKLVTMEIQTEKSKKDSEKILSLLNIVHSIVLSSWLPQDLSYLRIELLFVVFQGKNSLDMVKKAFSDLWDDISEKILSSKIMNADEFTQKILLPLIDNIWSDRRNNSISQESAISQIVDILRTSRDLLSDSKLSILVIDHVLNPLKKWNNKTEIISNLDIDPFYGIIISDKKGNPSSNILREYFMEFGFISHVYLQEFEVISPKIFFTKNMWILREIMVANSLLDLYSFPNSNNTEISFWNSLKNILTEICEDYLYPVIPEIDENTSFESLDFEIKSPSEISGLVLRLFLKNLPVKRKIWFENLLTRPDFMNLPLHLLESIFPNVISDVPEKTISKLGNDVLEIISNKGRESNTKPEDLEPYMGIWCCLSESTDKLSTPNLGSQLFVLLSTLGVSTMFDKLSFSMKTIYIRFTKSLLKHFEKSIPSQENNLWSKLWSILLSQISHENILQQKKLWPIYYYSVSLIREMILLNKNESFTQSKYDTVIVDGNIVQGTVNISGNIPQYITEWEFNKNKALKIITRTFLGVTNKTYSIGQFTVLSILAKTVIFSPETIITSIDQYNDILYKHILLQHKPSQISSYEILKMLIQIRNSKTAPILEQTKKEQSINTKGYDDQEEIITILPSNLRKIVENSPDSKSGNKYHQLGYYLGWLLVLEYFSGTKNGKEKTDISAYLRQKNIVTKILTNIFANIDTSCPPPSVINESTPMEQVAAYVFRQMVSVLPSMVRVWWGDLSNRSLTKDIDQFTTKFISPGIIAAEMSKVQAYNRDPSNQISSETVDITSNLTPQGAAFSVKACRGTTNEVQATYKKDEIEATITLLLADSHPLRAVSVSSSHRMGVNEATWRKWLLSMTTLLLTQDGSVLDAVLLWQASLENYFTGVELCPICYSLFHSSNFSIPNLTCKTCKSKFHGACLYKWFHTSQKNECPICKTLFN